MVEVLKEQVFLLWVEGPLAPRGLSQPFVGLTEHLVKSGVWVAGGSPSQEREGWAQRGAMPRLGLAARLF